MVGIKEGEWERKGNYEKNLRNTCDADLVNWNCDVFVCVLVVLMNEIQKWKEQHLTEEFYDRYERLKTDLEWWETVKYQFKQFCKETGVNKLETDVFTWNYVVPKQIKTIDKDRMKNESVYVIDAESGELTEVNAYDYFCTKWQFRSPYVTEREKE